ncbi:Mycolic acid cyclopropane synthetase [Fragilaria crotonensis]|nr:Mycolic acid cyclopropane synthetase [Fragilaria crotonensis]
MVVVEDIQNVGDDKIGAPADKMEKKVAVIGGGVSGLSAAWHLHQLQSTASAKINVHLFEAEDRLGGHAHTCTIQVGEQKKDLDVDIGFMVFNSGPDCNYPNMTAWFKELGVEEEDSDMSLSVSLDGGKTIEWNSDGLNGLFADRTQLFKPSFYRYISDMLRFNAEAAEILSLPKDDPRRVVTTGQYLRDHGYSQPFCTNYLLPMMAALWSASIEDVLQFPAHQLIAFLCNHKMLQLFQRPQWKTVAGRSKSYTDKVKDILGDNAHLSTPIVSVNKTVNGRIQYELFTTNNVSVGVFDELIFACHPPTAWKILNSEAVIDPEALDLLKQIEYADNVIYVHSDPKLMPLRRRAWASWNCLGKSANMSVLGPSKRAEAFEGGESGFGNTKKEIVDLEGEEGRMKAVYVTYWLNRLQNLKTDQEVFVSLNPHQPPAQDLIHKRIILAHPQFNPNTLRAREALDEKFQGKDGVWFCGAWEGYGFHEDGCRSGFTVATKVSGVPLPWGNSDAMVLAPPDLSRVKASKNIISAAYHQLYQSLTRDIPVAVCRRFIFYF